MWNAGPSAYVPEDIPTNRRRIPGPISALQHNANRGEANDGDLTSLSSFPERQAPSNSDGSRSSRLNNWFGTAGWMAMLRTLDLKPFDLDRDDPTRLDIPAGYIQFDSLASERLQLCWFVASNVADGC